MNEFNFKGEDRVYYPLQGNSIFKLANIETKSGRTLKIFDLNNQFFYTKNPITFYPNGFHHLGVGNPSIFPATQEWYERLSHVYPNLEKPPIKKSSKEIIQTLLDDGNAGVLCWVSDNSIEPNSNDFIEVILGIDDYYKDYSENRWLYATPITPIKSLNQIVTDYVDGKLVLESESVE